MSPSWVQTRRWKSVPTGASGRSKSVSARSKYAVSCRTASASTGSSSERAPSGRPSTGWRNGENSIATIEPSRSTMRRSPTGEGITVHMSVLLVSAGRRGGVGHQGVPQVHQGVGAPWSPALGIRVAGAGGREVGRQQDVGVPERPHRDVVRRPGADAGQVEQRTAYVVAVGATVEQHLPVGEGGGQPDECPTPRAGHRQGGRVGR